MVTVVVLIPFFPVHFIMIKDVVLTECDIKLDESSESVGAGIFHYFLNEQFFCFVSLNYFVGHPENSP